MGAPGYGTGRARPEWHQTSRSGVPGARRGHPGGRRENGLADGLMGGAAFVCVFHAVRGSGASEPRRFHALPETPASGCLPATPGGPPGQGPPPAARIAEKTRHIGHAGGGKAAKIRGPRNPGFSRHGKTRRIGAPGTRNPRKNTCFPDSRRPIMANSFVKTRISSALGMPVPTYPWTNPCN